MDVLLFPNAVLCSRLVYLFNDSRLPGRTLVIVSLIQVALCFINVVALLIAAKGFARFRQMDERAFAEYVLIGTLASTLLTVLVAQTIGGLSGG